MKHTRPQRITKSEIAELYGVTWRTFKKRLLILIPSLKGSRRKVLLPIEIQIIFQEFGKPEFSEDEQVEI